MNKFKNITISYENMTIEECFELYNKNVCCICDADRKAVLFKEENNGRIKNNM